MMRIIQHREGGTPSYWRFTAEVATIEMPKMAMMAMAEQGAATAKSAESAAMKAELPQAM